VLAAIDEAPAREELPVAVGVGGEPSTLFVWDLQRGRKLWERPASVRSAPHVLGSYVVTEEEGRVVARDLETGEERFTYRDEELRLVGGDGEGDRAVIGLSTGSSGDEAYSTVLLARGGELIWAQSVGFAIGSPALRGDYVFVPWMTHSLSVLSGEDGRQLLRLRMDDVIGHAFVQNGKVYTGQHGVFRLTPSFEYAQRAKAARYAPLARPLPGQPPLLRDGYESPLGADSAVHRVRLAWRVTGEDETVGFEDQTLYFIFYKLVFALSADEDELRWVYHHDSDLVGVAAQPGGLLLADEGGDLLFLSAESGRQIWGAQTGQSPVVVRFRAANLSPEGEPEGRPSPLADQLFQAAQMNDPRLPGGRALAIRFLSRIEDGEVTSQLITVCDDGDAPEQVRDAACEALAERSTGGPHVITALRRRAAFLQGEEAPPVGPLARAAERMELRAAVPLLLQHLVDPHTPDDALPPIMQALKNLAGAPAARPIEEFLVLYHADPSSEGLTQALGVAVEALARLRRRGALPTLQALAGDEMTVPSVRARATQAIARLEGSRSSGSGGQGTSQP
jgi:outer membrane protein assembly factor BamB